MGLWGVVKKAINSDLTTPLNVKLDAIYNALGRRKFQFWDTAEEFALFELGEETILDVIEDYTAEELFDNRNNCVVTDAADKWSISGSTGNGTSANTYCIAADSEKIDLTAASKIVCTYQGTGANDPNRIKGVGVWENLGLRTHIKGSSFGDVSLHSDMEISVNDLYGEYYVGGFVSMVPDAGAMGGSIGVEVTKLWIYFSEAYIFDDKVLLAPGVTTTTVISPAFAPVDLLDWDIIIYNIDAHEGSYQVDLLDGLDDSVITEDLNSNESIMDIAKEHTSLKIRVTLNRPTAGHRSPEIVALALAYI